MDHDQLDKIEQQAREKSEHQYHTLFHDACYAIWLMRPDGSFIECNPTTLKIYRTDNKKQFLEHTFASLAPLEQSSGTTSKQKAEELIHAALENGHNEFEWLTKGFDGKIFWAHVSLTKLTMDHQDLLQAILRDIDQEKRSQRLLKESEMRKEFIIKNAGLTMWIWNMRTGITEILSPNSPLASHFPKNGILVHDEMTMKVHPDDQEAFHKDIHGMVAGTLINPELEYRYQNPKGGWTWIKSKGMVVERDEQGKPLIAIGFHQDITKRKKYEEGLLDTQKITEEANRAKSLFLANMSHEIRTPMTAILGYLDLICDNEITPIERDEYAQTMQRNGMHLLDLINDILDLSKIEAGQIDLNPSYAQTAQLIDNVVGPLEALANEKGVSLFVDYLSVIPEKIWTDARFLRQILWNIIGNAIKFTDEGQIRVVIEYLPSPESEMKRGKRKTVLKIRIQDSGCGIPHERLDTIFDPFVQADSTATRQFSGTGLGLAIARRQAEMLSGTIRAWNNLAGGATFELIHPLEQTEGVPLIQPESILPLGKEKEKEKKKKDAAPITLQGVNVLLAEDGMDNQRLISTVLRKAGATIDIANNGQEAIEMVQSAAQKEYDVILMDMQMPLLDGYAATSKLREMKVDTPIIALTAHAMSGDRQKCLESGCDSYCTKPVRPKKLVTLISRYAKVSKLT